MYAARADLKFTYLLAALLALVLAPLVVGQTVTRSVTFGLALLAVLVVGFLLTLRHRKARAVALALALLAAAGQVLAFVAGEQRFPEFRLAGFIAFLAFLVAILVRDVLSAEAVTWDTIQGAICAYLLIGLTWGLLHVWVVMENRAAYGGVLGVEGPVSIDAMLYYSFVTLTTLGYGDIVPLSHAARTLSWLEAAFGQIYLTVLVARLVGLHLSGSARGAS